MKDIPELIRLKNSIARAGRIVIAFSGGVDSAFLASACREYATQPLLAITLDSVFISEDERSEARMIAESIGIAHHILHVDPLALPEVRSNPIDRCYHCKKLLFAKLKQFAASEGFDIVADGQNADDSSDYRPGAKAARELGIWSPLADAGLRKADIRILSRERGLPGWDRPAAACLASRIPYGEAITRDNVLRVEAAEGVLRGLGHRLARVRHIGDTASIEVAPENILLVAGRDNAEITRKLLGLGFRRVVLDLAGYRTGSLNPPDAARQQAVSTPNRED